MKSLIETIVKTKSGYKLISKKTGRNLGSYSSKAGAQQREREVQYFKHMKEDGVVANSVSGGNIAGLGVGKQGEPGVNPKRKKGVLPFSTFMRRKPNVDS